MNKSQTSAQHIYEQNQQNSCLMRVSLRESSSELLKGIPKGTLLTFLFVP